MRKFIFFTISIIVLIFALSLSNNSSQAQNDGVTPTPILSPTATLIIENDTETALLKQEVELLEKYNQQLLNTIYWSMGAVFTLALFVVGAGWYVNFRLYEKDKIELQRSLETSLGVRFEKEETALRERFEKEKETIQNVAQKAGEAAAAKLRSQFDELKWDLEYIQYKMLQEQAKSWRIKEVYSNELSTYFEMVRIAQKLYRQYWEWLLSDALEGMQNALKSGGQATVEDVREMTKVIDSLDKNYALEVSKLKELLSASKDKTG